MPLKPGEFPDPRRHRFCRTCQTWHYPEDGIESPQRPGGPFGSLIAGWRTAAGMDPPLVFTCTACRNRAGRPLRRLALVMALLLLGAIAWVMVELLLRQGRP